MFDLLADCVKSGQENWFVQDFAEETLFSRFTGKNFDEKRLTLVDEKIAAHGSSGKSGYSSDYELARLLTLRFDLMKKLSQPEEELDAFLEQYTATRTGQNRQHSWRRIGGTGTADAGP